MDYHPQRYFSRIPLILCCALFFVLTKSFQPTIKVHKCSLSEMLFTLSGASNVGMVSLVGHAYGSCAYMTTNETTNFTMDFASCGVTDGYSSMRLVVQKKLLYQTSSDLWFTFACVTQMEVQYEGAGMDIISNFIDGAGINFTVRPSVAMDVVRRENGRGLGKGSARLGENMRLQVQLGLEFQDQFDIRMKSCSAGTLLLYDEFCPVHSDVFGNFVQMAQGQRYVDFGAFRPTGSPGEITTVPFTCILEMCIGPCAKINCLRPGNKPNRRKRSIIEDETVAYDNVNVGTLLRVRDIGIVDDTKKEKDKPKFCMDKFLFITPIALLICIILVLTITSIYSFYKTSIMIAQNNNGLNCKGNNRESENEDNTCVTKNDAQTKNKVEEILGNDVRRRSVVELAI